MVFANLELRREVICLNNGAEFLGASSVAVGRVRLSVVHLNHLAGGTEVGETIDEMPLLLDRASETADDDVPRTRKR